MEEKLASKDVLISNELSQEISSLSISKQDLRKLCKLLQERAREAAEIEFREFDKERFSEEELQEIRAEIEEGFELKVTIRGVDGEDLYGAIDTVFESPNFPERLKTFFIDSSHIFKAKNYNPRNGFQTLLDFSKPAIFNFNLMPSHSTPNSSNFKVWGYESTWTNGLFSEIDRFFKSKSSSFSVVHRHTIYDLMLWFLGFPFSFWVCFKMSSIVKGLGGTSPFLDAALYFYIFLASATVFRSLFHYLRWVCPLVEYKEGLGRILGHRAVLGALIISLFGSFFYDLFKAIF